ncbi:MAG: class I SAM-dependent methyltransferase [Acidobacteria bacterium]|nr:class I SAM-dependent methyltransferase [Acidobacteriota bacterium]
MLARAFLRRWRLVREAYHILYRRLLPIHWWLVDRFSQQAAPPGMSLPPARLRFRVAESTSASLFFRVGERASKDIEVVLAEAGYAVNNFTNILDFGCGCGRTLTWLLARFPAVNWQGTDVDAEAIEWCRRYIPNASFRVNTSLPPLDYPNATFDLVYAVSVFTHLSDEYQHAWIPEFRRVLRPSGLLLLTFHSEHVWKALDDDLDIERRGLVFRTSTKLKGILPEWYQTTLQTADHILNSLSRHFTVVRHSSRGLGDQDVVIARRD